MSENKFTKEDLKGALTLFMIAVFFWAVISMFASAMKTTDDLHGVDNCGKTYPINYFVYTNLFCEIKEES